MSRRHPTLPILNYCTRCEGKWLLYADGTCPECDHKDEESDDDDNVRSHR